MAWKGSYAYGSVPGDASSTRRYNWASRPELIRTGDLKQHSNSILSRYLTEEVSKEPLFEEADDTMASGTEEACLSGLGKMKSEDSWATLRENTLRARADCHSQEDIEAGRKVRARQSNGVTFHSRKTGKCRSVAKDLPGVKTSFSADRQPEALPDKETNLAGCKAGISGLLFSSVCSSFAKINNAGQKRYSFGNFGCTSAPDVYLPTSATKVVRASADWDAKRPRHKSSKIRRATAGSFGATFANYSGKSFESRAQLTSRSICNQSSTPPSRKQKTPIVDPDMWCSRSLSLMTDATSFDCVVPSGKVHACGRNYTAPDSSENANRVAGTHLNRNSREHSCTTKRGEKPEKISDVLLDLGSESGCPVAEVSSIARSHQLQRSRRSSRGGLGEILSVLERSEGRDELSYEQLLMLEATFLLGGIDIYDQHRDLRLDVDSMSYEDLLELGDRIGYVNTGLSEDAIFQCLQKIKHCIMEARSTCLTENERKCSICQEEYEANDELGKLQCGHSYHVCCIKQWLLQKNACPVCKASVLS